MEEVEEYNYREVMLPSLIPVVAEPELERETGERRRGRDIVIAVDHGPNSKHAFDWALAHFCRLADTLHLVHAVSGSSLSCFSFSFFLSFYLYLFSSNQTARKTVQIHFLIGMECFADLKNQLVYDTTQGLMEKLAVEAFQVVMVSYRLSLSLSLSIYGFFLEYSI